MCAQYELEKSMFTEKIGKLKLDISDFNFQKRILPHTKSPVLFNQENKLILKDMSFSLIPWWSKDKKPKFATHNARLETVLEKPTWKNIFGKKHCLIPMTSFIEPIYEGSYAGNMVKFNLSECLFVPGLFDIWMDKSTGEIIKSFAIITTTPPKFIEECGHDRSPIFIDQEKMLDWVNMIGKNNQYYNDILKQKWIPDFKPEIDRKLKKGWEKRL